MELDFTKILFRPSSIGNLMPESSSTSITKKQLQEIARLTKKGDKITEKQKVELERLIKKRDAPPELSSGAESFLLEFWIDKRLGRSKNIDNKYTLKGNWAEEASITLLSEVANEFYEKNEERYTNEYITGTPDIVDSERDTVIDIKSRFDIWTFMNNEKNPIYYWQLQAYMWLTDCKNATLAYTLVDTPRFLIEAEKKKRAFQLSQNSIDFSDEDYKLEMEQIEKNNIYSDIISENRIKFETFEYSEGSIAKMKQKIDMARNWLVEFDNLNFKQK